MARDTAIHVILHAGNRRRCTTSKETTQESIMLLNLAQVIGREKNEQPFNRHIVNLPFREKRKEKKRAFCVKLSVAAGCCCSR